jgi:hypothetical protein
MSINIIKKQKLLNGKSSLFVKDSHSKTPRISFRLILLMGLR